MENWSAFVVFAVAFTLGNFVVNCMNEMAACVVNM